MTQPLRVSAAVLAALALALPASGALGQSMPGGALNSSRNTATTLDEPKPEGGWDGLARLLEAVKPAVDTRLDPTPAQITDHIEKLLAQGRNDEALDMIQKRLAATSNRSAADGTDVQLQFQHARALAALGRADEAMDVYRDMTQRYPELPEPWNNMAVLHAKRGDIDRAQQALENALRAAPDYAAARANLADIQLMQAKRSYNEASRLGVSGTQNKARAVDNLLKEKQTQ